MSYINKRILTSIVLLLIIYFSLMNLYVLLIFLLILNYFAIVEFYQIFKKIFNKKKKLFFLSILSSVIYLIYFSLIIWFYLGSSEYQTIALIFLILICVATDTGGFVCGKLFGGKKLTRISPNKTYSGMIGSFIFSILFGYFFYYLQNNFFILEVNIFFVILIVSSISQVGDLTVSLLKRKAKIKDTGSILPGHGGILDRIDGILLAIPIGIFIISI